MSFRCFLPFELTSCTGYDVFTYASFPYLRLVSCKLFCDDSFSVLKLPQILSMTFIWRSSRQGPRPPIRPWWRKDTFILPTFVLLRYGLERIFDSSWSWPRAICFALSLNLDEFEATLPTPVFGKGLRMLILFSAPSCPVLDSPPIFTFFIGLIWRICLAFPSLST